MTAEDFVDVQLTKAGTAAAGQGDAACIRIAGGSVAGFDYEYIFKPGKALRVPMREFSARLATVTMNDQPLFEIVTQAKKSDAKAAHPAAGSEN